MLRRPPHVAHGHDRGRVLLLDLRTGRHHGLSPQASAVWDLLSAGADPAGAAAALAERFGADAAVVAADVARLVDELRALGLLEESG